MARAKKVEVAPEVTNEVIEEVKKETKKTKKIKVNPGVLLRVRQEPNENSEILTIIDETTTYEVLEEVGEFSKIDLGFIMTKFTKVVED